MPNIDSAQPQQQNYSSKISNHVSLISPGGKPPKKRRRILKWFFLTFLTIILILGIAVFSRAASLSSKIFVGTKVSFFQRLKEVFTGGEDTLVGEDAGQVNILLLGIGGEGHDGPYLTDTMILAQIRPRTGEVVLTSIPRDYWVNMPDGGQAKINQAFSNGYLKNHDYNEGGQYAEQVVEKLTGLKVPYFAVIDFSGFEKAVDQVGGLDIKVDNTFTDYQYPDSGTGYLPPQTFIAGWHHMDGTTALIFARSRHGNNNEGSDFARSLRQQKVIQAFKEKVLNLNLITDAGKINSLLDTFADHFHTNLAPGEIYRLYNISKQKSNKILSLALTPDTGLICAEITADTGAYILTPCPDKSESDVENYFKNAFAIGKLEDEKAVVWLADSTGNQQAYDTAFRKLTDAGIIVYALSYTKDNLPNTLVYQVNPKPATDEFIQNILFATEATLPPPGVNPNKANVDVIVVLGKNAPVETPPKLYIPPPARIPTTTTSTVDSFSTSTPAVKGTSTSTKPSASTIIKPSTAVSTTTAKSTNKSGVKK